MDTPANKSALRPRARIMRTLGDELISSETVALTELVKNSYDADATRLLIRFTGPLEPGHGRIEVIDNGHGMSLTTVRTAWMQPATPTKRQRPRSDKFQRRVLGEKGVGRFAASRLADELELITRADGDEREVYAIFDWRQFDDEEKFLDEVLILTDEQAPVEIAPGGTIDALWSDGEGVPEGEGSHGTVLRMNELKRRWTEVDVKELQRSLSRLLPPYRVNHGFHVRLELLGELAELSTDIGPPDVYQFPHYQVRGRMLADGRFSFTVKVNEVGETRRFRGRFAGKVPDLKRTGGADGKRGGKGDDGKLVMHQFSGKDGEVPSEFNRVPACGPLAFTFRVWDRDELGNIARTTNSSIPGIRRDLDSIAGVSIYRDDFRVLPYGEPHDDWLRLDIRRVQKPTLRLSNNQIVGVIRIGADRNRELRDQSNRQGLIDNEAFQDLRDILLNVLTATENVRYAFRRERREDNLRGKGSLFSFPDFGPLRAAIKAGTASTEFILQSLEAADEATRARVSEIQHVVARYQRLATLGQLIDVTLHDGRTPVAKIRNKAIAGREDVEDALKGADDPLLVGLRTKLELIENQAALLGTVFRRLEPFGGRKRGRPSEIALEEIIRNAFGVFDSEIRRANVKVELPTTSNTLVRVDEAEIQEVIVNLLQNSLYWVQRVDRNARAIVVRTARSADQSVTIVFSDSGPGVDPDFREVVFDAYFSTKPDGIGLGLSIAGEIVKDYYNGDLALLDEGPLPGATFLITLRHRV